MRHPTRSTTSPRTLKIIRSSLMLLIVLITGQSLLRVVTSANSLSEIQTERAAPIDVSANSASEDLIDRGRWILANRNLEVLVDRVHQSLWDSELKAIEERESEISLPFSDLARGLAQHATTQREIGDRTAYRVEHGSFVISVTIRKSDSSVAQICYAYREPDETWVAMHPAINQRPRPSCDWLPDAIRFVAQRADQHGTTVCLAGETDLDWEQLQSAIELTATCRKIDSSTLHVESSTGIWNLRYQRHPESRIASVFLCREKGD